MTGLWFTDLPTLRTCCVHVTLSMHLHPWSERSAAPPRARLSSRYSFARCLVPGADPGQKDPETEVAMAENKRKRRETWT